MTNTLIRSHTGEAMLQIQLHHDTPTSIPTRRDLFQLGVALGVILFPVLMVLFNFSFALQTYQSHHLSAPIVRP